MGAIQQLMMARGYTLSRLKKITKDDVWDAQPAGFSNTIRWNVGHILVLTEEFLGKALPDYEPQYIEWNEYFVAGSSPSEWQGVPPSEEQLIKALKEQSKQMSIVTEGKHEQATDLSIGKIITMKTVDEVLQFLAWHEGIHAGLINGIVKANV